MSAGALHVADHDGVQLAYRARGAGAPVLLIHGSWEDHGTWDVVAKRLAQRRSVIVYDRRGHSASSAPPGQGRIGDDVADARFLVERHSDVPVTIVGHSYGGTVALLLAARHPGLVDRVVVHEPPLFGLLADDPAWAGPLAAVRAAMTAAAADLDDGRIETGVRRFVDEVAFGPDAWTGLFDERTRHVALANWSTWLDQHRDPDRLALGPEVLASVRAPTVVTTGTASLPWYPAIARRLVDGLPDATLMRLDGVGHGAHHAQPLLLVDVVLSPRV